jgi:hypothetical protein
MDIQELRKVYAGQDVRKITPLLEFAQRCVTAAADDIITRKWIYRILYEEEGSPLPPVPITERMEYCQRRIQEVRRWHMCDVIRTVVGRPPCSLCGQQKALCDIDETTDTELPVEMNPCVRCYEPPYITYSDEEKTAFNLFLFDCVSARTELSDEDCDSAEEDAMIDEIIGHCVSEEGSLMDEIARDESGEYCRSYNVMDILPGHSNFG